MSSLTLFWIAETYRLKLRVSETQKANANDKLQVANLTEEIENLNKNIVPSPQVAITVPSPQVAITT